MASKERDRRKERQEEREVQQRKSSYDKSINHLGPDNSNTDLKNMGDLLCQILFSESVLGVINFIVFGILRLPSEEKRKKKRKEERKLPCEVRGGDLVLSRLCLLF